MWAAAGGGWGTAANVRETGLPGWSDLDLRLGLVEARREVGVPGGVALGVRADAAWAQLRTGAGEETVDGQTAAVNQLRAGAEVSWPLRWADGSVSPFGEMHVRRHGGAGQRGDGLEVVAGTRLAQGWLRVDAQGRLLVLHSALGYRERGVGVTVGIGSRDREGLSLSVSPRWGDGASSGGTLWQEQVYGRYLPEAATDEWALDARGDYGLRLPGGTVADVVRVAEPVGLRPPVPGRRAGRRWRVAPAALVASDPADVVEAPVAAADAPANAASPAPRLRTVAVARFVNRSAAPADAWVGRGIVESVAIGFEQLFAVRMIRAGAAGRAGERVRPARLADRRRVRAGRWMAPHRREGDRRVDRPVVASATDEGAWGDLFALQDRITDALAAALVAEPPAASLRAAARRR